jgi:chemotaxis protein MotB
MSSEEQNRPRIVIKKKRGGHGHHGGAWKVAYADFITAMMALFLLLWLVSQGDQKLKEALANYFRNPGVFSSSSAGILPGGQGLNKEGTATQLAQATPPVDQEMAVLQRAAKQMEESFSKVARFASIRNQIRISVTREGLEIQLVEKAGRVFFDVGSAHPKDYTRDVLLEIAKEIGQLPNQIIISGHTDHRLYSSPTGYTNWELSTDRANSARRILTENGLKPEQVVRIVGYADTVPIEPKDPYADANRRIAILVLSRAAPVPSSTVTQPPESAELHSIQAGQKTSSEN